MSLRFLVVLAWLLFAGPLHAQPSGETAPRKYAVLSLIGDALNIVVYQPQRGSNDTNRRESIPLADAPFDKAALLAADAALRRSDIKASVVLLAPSSKALYEEQDRLFSGAQAVLPDDVAAALKAAGATHLVLLTKYRGDAHLQAARSGLGSGKLEGLGYYVDRVFRMKRTDTGEVGVGFLAPFFYVRASLIDVATSTILRDEIVTATTTLSAARSKEASDPWDVLTPAEKIESMKQLTTREVSRVIPILVGGKN